MSIITDDALLGTNLQQEPVEVADRIWWVGCVLEDDRFQCHPYLIEQGDESILIDPGSQLTFAQTFAKVEQIVPFSHIKYFICHHQDPDITGALNLIDALISRKDAVLICHGRAKALIRHLGFRLPFWLIEEHDWHLQLKDRTLEFIFTPYAHFPGAFCSFDTKTGVLFSSDLFGGFTEQFSLIAKDKDYFNAIRPFHEHYMPTNEILSHALSNIERYPVKAILPQHGSIIPEHLVSFMINKLKELDCGLYLMVDNYEDVMRLSRLNQMLRNIMKSIVLSRDFRSTVQGVVDVSGDLLDIEKIDFYTEMDEGKILSLSADNGYRGTTCSLPIEITKSFSLTQDTFSQFPSVTYDMRPKDRETGCVIVLPLRSPEDMKTSGMGIIHLKEAPQISSNMTDLLQQLAVPLHIAVEREALFRAIDMERQRFYERAIRDPLTGLFTRLYMQENMKRQFDIHDRDESAAIAVAMLDIDHFKSVNDTYGHNQGDVVLKQVAGAIQDEARKSDLPVRLGGEEFAVFTIGKSARHIGDFAERMRMRVAALKFEEPMSDRSMTISIGTAIRKQQESINDFTGRADKALYSAKNGGRNQVCSAE